VTTNQILIGVVLILVLAAGSHVLASQLRIPALIVLLPVDFAATPSCHWVRRPQDPGPAGMPARWPPAIRHHPRPQARLSSPRPDWGAAGSVGH
jgi:hypothetical protein